jgi:hypothetical protein
MEDSRRHKLLWNIAFYPLKLYLCLRFNYHPKVQPIDGPSLIVSNHVTDLDPLLLALTVRKFTYFVASEHVFRRFGKLLIWAQGPISRMKGTTAGSTAMTILRRLKKGFNVALFPEANRTFNGANLDIIESTAKLARSSGAKLVTHRFRGGYLTSPRWSGDSIRRGRMTGEIVGIYPPEELKKMTTAEIADLIRRDIREDAYETQAEWQIPYKGKNLAEHIERTLCVCPVCKELGAMTSRGNSFGCTACGMTGTYTELGYLEGEGLPFRTVLDWDRWQAQELRKRADNAGDACIAEDDNIDLHEVNDDFEEFPVASGTLRLFADRLEIADRVFPVPDISGIAINGPQILTFTIHDRHYTLTSKRIVNLRKYITLYYALTAPDKILSL